MRQLFLNYYDKRIFLYILLIQLCLPFFTGCSRAVEYRSKQENNEVNWRLSELEEKSYLKRPNLVIKSSENRNKVFNKYGKHLLKTRKFQETPTNTFNVFLVPPPRAEYYKS